MCDGGCQWTQFAGGAGGGRRVIEIYALYAVAILICLIITGPKAGYVGMQVRYG